MIRHYLILVAAMTVSSSLHAADIASDVQAGLGGYDNSDGGYFEFGVGLNLNANEEAIKLNADILLAGAYRYRRFFFEAIRPGFSLSGGHATGLTLGVNVWGNDRWVVDFLGVSTSQKFSRLSRIDFSESEDSERDRDVFFRDSVYTGAGVRLTGYLGDTVLQFRLSDDVYRGKGVTGSARAGYSRQVNNWNIHSVLSANYTSQKTGQYWYGVSADEASTFIPQYDIRSPTMSYSAEIGATYPVRENVVFRSTARYSQLDNEVANSPLQEGDFRVRWNTSLSYVF